MDIDSFVKKVFELKPTYESLEHLAISDSLKHEIINSYIINKNPKVNIKSYSNMLERLIYSYDLTSLNIYNLSFSYGITKIENFLIFGKYEVDYVALDNFDSEIKILDSNNINHIVFYCSRDINCFFDLLLFFITEKTKHITEKKYKLSPELERQIIDTAIKISGGAKYETFCRVITGIYR